MKKNNQIFTILTFFLFLALTFSACEYEVITPETIDVSGDVSFSTDIQPMFDADCAGCHNGGTPPNLTEGNAYNSLISGGYVNTSDPENSELLIKIDAGHPNDNATSAAERSLIVAWISQGAQNN